MPRTFQLPTSDTRFWRPLSVLPLWPETTVGPRQRQHSRCLAASRRGSRFEEARAEMAVIAARLREAHAVNRNIDVRIIPLVRSRGRQPDTPRHVARVCRGAVPARHRVRQRRRPALGASRPAAARAGGPLRARRRAGPAGPPAAGRRRQPLGRGQRRRRAAGLRVDPAAAGVRAARASPNGGRRARRRRRSPSRFSADSPSSSSAAHSRARGCEGRCRAAFGTRDQSSLPRIACRICWSPGRSPGR